MKKGKFIRLVFTLLLLAQCMSVVVFEHVYLEEYRTGKGIGQESGEIEKTVSGEISDEPGELYAQSAVLMDADSGRILFGKNEETVRPMASTTKIMTCILALEHMNEGQKAKASKLAESQPKVRLNVKEGETFYVKDLLYSLMLESHNDSAVVVAEAIGGSVEEFAAMMNEKAKELGCENTHFVTPNGLDGENEDGMHATTAADLARIMRYCITESPGRKEFLEITGTRNYSFTDVDGKRSFSCTNHNAFLDMMEGALTGKTGFTAKAGYCYVGALKQDERTFIVALLACGWPGNKSYKWRDTKALMQYGLTNYHYRNVNQEFPGMEIEVKEGVGDENPFASDIRVKVGVPEAEEQTGSLRALLKADEKVTVKRNLKDSLNAPVKKGEHAGEWIYLLEGEELARYEIVTLEEIKKRTFIWCVGKVLSCYLIRQVS